uniref:Uncharacterized protein n=1 Tax=Oryza brachyantha TaxID=4533 RepID=J3M552_ORYBR
MRSVAPFISSFMGTFNISSFMGTFNLYRHEHELVSIMLHLHKQLEVIKITSTNYFGKIKSALPLTGVHRNFFIKKT